MTTDELQSLRFPIGQYEPPAQITAAHLAGWIDEIEALPGELRAVVAKLTQEQLDRPYREGGWTGRQVVHHIGDSHLNSYVRFKWALTEDRPTIKAYDEAAWAKTADYCEVPVELALDFLDALHRRWVILLRSLTPEQLARAFFHPESGQNVVLDYNVGMYAWHGKHHLAHVMSLLG